MKTASTALATTALAVLISPSAVNADPGFYYGIGLGATSASSLSEFDISSEGTLGTLNLTLGHRFENNNVFYAIEGSADLSFSGTLKFQGLSCADAAAGPYFCEHQATVRLQAQVGTEVGQAGYEIFGSLGYAIMYGDAAINPFETASGSTGGATIGLGVQRAMSNGSKIRVELVHDMLSNTISQSDIYSPEWKATSVSVSYVKGF